MWKWKAEMESGNWNGCHAKKITTSMNKHELDGSNSRIDNYYRQAFTTVLICRTLGVILSEIRLLSMHPMSAVLHVERICGNVEMVVVFLNNTASVHGVR